MCRFFRDVEEVATVKGWVPPKIQINKTLLKGSSRTLSNIWWLRTSVSAGSVGLSWEERTWRCWTRKRREEDWWQSLVTWYDAARYISVKALKFCLRVSSHDVEEKWMYHVSLTEPDLSKKRTWWVKVLAHIVPTVLIFVHAALSFYETFMFFDWTKMFFLQVLKETKGRVKGSSEVREIQYTNTRKNNRLPSTTSSALFTKKRNLVGYKRYRGNIGVSTAAVSCSHLWTWTCLFIFIRIAELWRSSTSSGSRPGSNTPDWTAPSWWADEE